MFEKKKFLVSFALSLSLPLSSLTKPSSPSASASASGFPLTAAYPIHRLSLPTHASLAPTIHQQAAWICRVLGRAAEQRWVERLEMKTVESVQPVKPSADSEEGHDRNVPEPSPYPTASDE
ncbi:hypothetical protein BC567DRAFT_206805 [Phyllosticta citribraziliensis]